MTPFKLRQRVKQLVPGAAEGLGVRDVFGLDPLRPAIKQSWRAIRGHGGEPPTQFGLSSIKIFKPRISLPTWLGQRRPDRKAWVYNLVNRHAPPPNEPFSVKVTNVQDFRGGDLTYDSHRGTDFAVPVGTPIITPAPGIIADVRSDMDRGGRKVCFDHGAGLFTTLNHLANHDTVSRYAEPLVWIALWDGTQDAPPLQWWSNKKGNLQPQLRRAAHRFINSDRGMSRHGETWQVNPLFIKHQDNFIDWAEAKNLCDWMARHAKGARKTWLTTQIADCTLTARPPNRAIQVTDIATSRPAHDGSKGAEG